MKLMQNHILAVKSLIHSTLQWNYWKIACEIVAISLQVYDSAGISLQCRMWICSDLTTRIRFCSNFAAMSHAISQPFQCYVTCHFAAISLQCCERFYFVFTAMSHAILQQFHCKSHVILQRFHCNFVVISLQK